MRGPKSVGTETGEQICPDRETRQLANRCGRAHPKIEGAEREEAKDVIGTCLLMIVGDCMRVHVRACVRACVRWLFRLEKWLAWDSWFLTRRSHLRWNRKAQLLLVPGRVPEGRAKAKAEAAISCTHS